MLDAADHVYLTDFGLAKTVGQSGVTQTGAVIGTPYYMSPEQVKGEPAGPQSDLYSLGIILYEMATGSVPYAGKSVYEVMIQRIQKPPRPVAEVNPEIPGYLQKIIERCLAIDPKVRYQSAAEILADLDRGSVRPTLRFEIHRRRWLRPAAAAAVAAVLLAVGGWWLYTRGRAAKPAAPHAAQSVLIADFVNRTGDPVFDGTLEPAFSIALEGASFVTSYSRNQAKKVAAQLQPGTAGLDETLARLVAVREGVNVVTSGSVEKRGEGYEVSVRALDPATGKKILSGEEKASGKEAVLASVARLAAKVRGALGDRTPEAAQLAAAETFSAGSLEAAHEYAVAQDFQWAGNWEEAIRHYRKSLDLDSNLGRAWAGLAAVESNRGRRQDAEKNYKEALARIDRMSDREKYRTRGGYYLLTRNPDNAIEEFTALVKQYPADTAGIANLAFAYFYKRDMARALEEGRRAIAIYPKNVPQRNNVGLYAMYAGDFETGIREPKTVLELNPQFVSGYVGLALSQLGAGRPAEAQETWNRLAKVGPAGASSAAGGRADLALYEGRLKDAGDILEKAIEEDTAAGNSDEAARKLTTLAEARLRQGQTSRAMAASERALTMSRDLAIAVSAARVLVGAGEEKKALAVADELAQRIEPDPQMYALLLRGEVELRRRNTREAIAHFKEAQKKADAWLVRYDLARAYVEGGFYAEADTELDACVKRRGEATALFLDDVPTDRAFAPVSYYVGRAREGLKSPGAAESYRAFLATQKGEGDTLTADAKRRLEGKA
jgi:tetratricopeptide (TPR) repeat protein